MRWIRTAVVIAAALLAGGSLPAALLAGGSLPATTGASPDRIVSPQAAAFTPIDASGFTLDPAGTAATYQDLVSRLESDSRIHRATLSGVLSAGVVRTGTWPLCHPTHLSSTYSPSGFCWDHDDDTTDQWVPQGITGSGDASATGYVDGKRLLAASWHAPSDAFARVSIADYTKPSAGVPYHHLLLVEPYLDSTGAPNFRTVQNVHADGLMWYGNRLFLATGTRLQVFSLDHIWQTVTSGGNAGDIGLYADGAHARWHAWALPMIAEYRTVWGADGGWVSCNSKTGTKPCLNSISLAPDRTSFVTAEYFAPTDGSSPAGARVIRWPLTDSSTGLPETGVVHASEAYSSPVWHMQGAATDGTAFYLTGDCPGTPPAGTDPNDWVCLHRALPGQPPHVLTQGPPLTQNLSYWPQTGELWGINERTNTSTGARVVFKIIPNP
ncbi:hypothetical protein AB0I55_03940 [Actinocatenispora sera]|uniref:hypothetical protein n=1 Tax=Actinocatenispora sera TaxID=390989 RepID=UPI0033D559E4